MKFEQLLQKLTNADEDEYDRANAAYALAQLGDKRAIAPLIAAVFEDKYIRESALSGLRLFSENAVKPLCDVLLDRIWVGNDISVLIDILYTLGVIENVNAFDTVILFVYHEDAIVRAAAINAIGNINEPRGLSYVYKFLSDPTSIVRAGAIEALVKLHATQLLGQIVPFLEDSEPEVRREAVLALGTLGGSKYAVEIRSMLDDPDEYVRSATRYILSELKQN